MILNEAVDSELIPARPRIQIRPCRPPRPPFYDPDQFERLVLSARRASIRTLVVVLLGGEAGLRPGEMLGLDWPDINFKEELIHVNHTLWKGQLLSPKSGEARIVPMSMRMRDALREFQYASVVDPPRARYGSRRGDERRRRIIARQVPLIFLPPPPPPPRAEPRTEGPVLFTSSGRRPTIQTLHVWVSDAKVNAGLPDSGGVKILRHTFGRRLRRRGADTEDIQELLGHADIRTTKIYTEEGIETLREYVRRLDATVSSPTSPEQTNTGL